MAFTAKLDISDSYPCSAGVLKFRNVLLNEGGGYDSETGIFTCPLGGFYHLTLHASTYGRAQCAIVQNENKLVSLYHTTLPDKSSQMASISCVVQLSTGDQVWVDVWGPGRNDVFANEDNDTVFIGARLG